MNPSCQMNPLVFTLSNRLELLYDSLSPYLYKNRTDPLGKILIIVPSAAMKSWFMNQAAEKQKIAFGFEVVLLNDAIRKLSLQNSSFLLNKTDLAIRIEAELKEMDNHPFVALFNQPLSTKQAKIASELAEVFLIYGEYHEDEIETIPTWQSKLWNRIYSHDSFNKPLYSYLKNLNVHESLPLQVHLFGFSYLSDVKQHFFETLNAHIPVHYWVLSPSRMLWSDHKSRKEQYFYTSLLQKQGVKFSQIQEMQAYLEESNPIIGNNGRLGRKWREKMEDSLSITSEVYGIADSFPEEDLMDGVMTFPSPSLTLLEAVQADLTLLTIRNEPLILNANDRSIEIHGAPSRFREIEALYETLIKACLSKDIHPGEIIVMAPDLEYYIPFIKTVFSRQESQLPFEIMERNSLGESSYIRLFFAFLELSDSRWELESLFEVLESPHFYEKNSLSFDDLIQVKSNLVGAGIRWGIDLTHRESVCKNPLIETTQKGSWKGGVESLLSSLIYTKEPGAKGILSFTQSEPLSLFLDLFQMIRQDLSFMLDSKERTVEEWKDLLNALIEKYLGSYADEESREDLQRIIRKLPVKISLNVKSLIVHLKSLAEETPTVYRSRNLQSVRFCPLLPMRAIPAEMVVVLGMNSESFPRIERKSPLAERSKSYVPTPTDYDRYLFLESLLSSRKKWILSYVNAEDKSPSCLIQEVTHYLDANFRIGEQYPSAILKFDHPEIPFDSGYFIANSPCPSPSVIGYKSALSYRKTIEGTSLELLPPIPKDALNTELLPKHLTLRQLKNFVYNPIQHHLNQAHGIYLQKEDPAHPDMIEFSEEKLWDSEWLKWALQYPIEKVVSLADLKGRFPCEPFKQPAKDRLKIELEERLENLAKNEIALSEIFEVEFSYDCKEFHQTSPQSFKAPAVTVPYRGQTISITGVLPYVSRKGYLSLREQKNETLIQMLPEILMLQELPLIEKQIIFIKKNKKMTPKSASWELFLDHFLRSLHQPLPHSPSWIASILTDNPKGLHQSIKLSVSDPFRKKEDPYLKWVFPQVEAIDCSKLICDWKDETVLQFGGLLETQL